MAKIEKSFYDWCIENNRPDLLDRWDYELNQDDINTIGAGINRKYFFKCPINKHNSELRTISYITRNSNVIHKCSQCNSFAQWGIDNICKDFLEKYWDYEKNININPWEISQKNNIKVWIKCQKKDYHGSYNTTSSHFYRGQRCSYCSGKKVHPKDSFAQYHIDHTDRNFLEKYWSNQNIINPYEITPYSRKNIWIKCIKNSNHPDYKTICNTFSNNHRCPNCSNLKTFYTDSLGFVRPEVLKVWSSYNNTSPFEYKPKSEKRVFWKCENNKHPDYIRDIKESNISDFRCPLCMNERKCSLLQEKVQNYINDMYSYNLYHEKDCSITPRNPKGNNACFDLPFDNEILELKLVIEVHGSQHYKISGYHQASSKHNNTTPEQELHKQQLHDRYKKYISYIIGYLYLEIPYWTEKDESYKQLIDNKIEEILVKNKNK